LISKYKGPYEIKKVLDLDRYVVGDIDDYPLTQKPFTTVVSPDQIKYWTQN